MDDDLLLYFMNNKVTVHRAVGLATSKDVSDPKLVGYVCQVLKDGASINDAVVAAKSYFGKKKPLPPPL